MIVCIDPGMKMGYAVEHEGCVSSGTYDLSSRRFEGGGMRYLRLHKWLCELHGKDLLIKELYFEEVRRHAGTTAAHVYGGMIAVISSFCEYNEIPYAGLSVGKIKKHLTGRGNANKQQVIDAIKKLGFDPADDNEADALAILKCVKDGVA